MKVLTVVGARPQFIKAAVVSRAMASAGGLSEVLVHTGQHQDACMSEVFFRELSIPAPVYHLGVGSGSHGAQTGRMLERLDEVMRSEAPDCVLVFGDTNSTLAGALAAAKLGLRLAHVEAGLRSFRRAMPEEINRVLTDHVSDILFVPTDAAVANLTREGISGDKVHLVGDVMYDAALTFAEKSDGAGLLKRLGIGGGEFALATVHRAGNTDDPTRLKNLLNGLISASKIMPVVFPWHPRTRIALERMGLLAKAEKYLICQRPFGYLEMLAALRAANVVITDSGGVQKEAVFFGTSCLIVRDETEWVELLETGCARLVAPQELADAVAHPPRGDSVNAMQLYGGGKASKRIAALLLGAAQN